MRRALLSGRPLNTFRESERHEAFRSSRVMETLEDLAKFVRVVDAAVYGGFEVSARWRLANP